MGGCIAREGLRMPRLAFADAARRGFGAGDRAALRGVQDGVLAAPVVAMGEVDPTER